MVLSLRWVYQPNNQRYNIKLYSGRDRKGWHLGTEGPRSMHVESWLDAGSKSMQIVVTDENKRSATIFIEDSGHWELVVSGDVEGSRHVVNVDGSKDFDVRFTDRGNIRLEVWGGKWGPNSGQRLELMLAFSGGQKQTIKEKIPGGDSSNAGNNFYEYPRLLMNVYNDVHRFFL